MSHPRWRLPILVLAGAALVVGAYANHFGNEFHFDDAHVIEENLSIRSLSNAPRFFVDATTFSALPDHQTYRPLLSLTYALDYELGGGLDPRVFHVTQLLFHLLVVGGVFLLVKAVGARAGVRDECVPVAAFFAAVLFGVHTANTETLNYLSSRSDILSTLGILGSLLTYAYLPRTRRFHLYLAPMLLGVLAKPPAVMFAPLLFLWVLFFEEETGLDGAVQPEAGPAVWRSVLRSAPAFAVALAAFLFVQGMNAETQSYGGGEPVEYLRTQPWVWLHYARLFVVPLGLTADTDWTILETWQDTRLFAGLAFVLVLGWLTVLASRRPTWRPASYGLAWFALGLLPSSSVFPLAEVANEHRIYLPFVGLALAAAWTGLVLAPRVGEGGRSRWVWGLGAVVILLLHGVGTWSRNQVWRTDESLWGDVVRKSPGNGRAWMNYGLTQMVRGRFDRANALFLEALDREPRYPPLHVNLGIVQFHQGDTAVAEASFQRALSLDPDYGPGHYFYGKYLLDAGRGPEAITPLRKAVELAPTYAPARRILLQLYYVLGSSDRVAEMARETLAVQPEDAVARGYLEDSPPLPSVEGDTGFERGLRLTGAGRHLEAAVAYRRHLDDVGPDPDAYLNLGWSLAQLGFDPLAFLAFQDALELRPGDPKARGNLEWIRGRMVEKGIPVP